MDAPLINHDACHHTIMTSLRALPHREPVLEPVIDATVYTTPRSPIFVLVRKY